MSQVWIHTEDAERGSTPARCVKTGARCITRHRLTSTDLSPAVEWLTWRGLWPRSPQQPGRAIVVSMLPWVHRTLTVLRVIRDVSVPVVIALLLVAALSGGSVARASFAAALVLVALKVLTAIIGMLWAPRVRIDATGEWLSLDRVHQDVVDAAEAVTRRPEHPPVLQADTVGSAAALGRATANEGP